MSTEVEPTKAPFLALPHEAPAALEPPPLTIIDPPKGWQLINARELWHCRELICLLAWRDVKVRYKQTLLGAVWAVLQPTMLMVVFTLFFGRLGGLSSGDVPYPLFAFAGLLPWTFFSSSLSHAANSLTNCEEMVTKIYFPRLAIPFSAVGTCLVDFGVALGVLLVLMLGYGVTPGVSMLLVLPIFAALLLTALGVGTLLAALCVAYRDFRFIVPFLLQVWMFATPTIYMQINQTPTGLVGYLVELNPLTGMVAMFRAAMLGEPISWIRLAIAFGWAATLFLVGCCYFRRTEDNFADIL